MARKTFMDFMSESQISPIVKDYFSYLDKAAKAHGAPDVQKYLNKAKATFAVMTAKGKHEAEANMTDAHKEFLKKARENDL